MTGHHIESRRQGVNSSNVEEAERAKVTDMTFADGTASYDKNLHRRAQSTPLSEAQCKLDHVRLFLHRESFLETYAFKKPAGRNVRREHLSHHILCSPIPSHP